MTLSPRLDSAGFVCDSAVVLPANPALLFTCRPWSFLAGRLVVAHVEGPVTEASHRVAMQALVLSARPVPSHRRRR